MGRNDIKNGSQRPCFCDFCNFDCTLTNADPDKPGRYHLHPLIPSTQQELVICCDCIIILYEQIEFMAQYDLMKGIAQMAEATGAVAIPIRLNDLQTLLSNLDMKPKASKRSKNTEAIRSTEPNPKVNPGGIFN